jgi:tricorn protease
MLKRLGAISLLAMMAGIVPVVAQPMGEAPRWIRDPVISPDGETVSFTYRGQIFVVSTEGGLAVPITALGAYSYGAIWSPDSEQLVFASNISGSDDIYLSDFSGTLRRMSWSALDEVPTSFSPDGADILYRTLGLGDAEQSVQAALSFKSQLYALDAETGRERLLLPNYALDARWNPAMDRLVYTYDPSGDAEIRQHRVAANARQLYLYDPASGRHERLFAVDGVDRLDAVWSADGTRLYYLSEASGYLNVWRHEPGQAGETQVTFFEGAPVRDLSIAEDGTLAFVQDGRIHAMAPGATDAQPISILTLDQRASIDENVRIAGSNEFVSSPDGEHFAVAAYGNIFLLDRAGNYRQLTTTAEEERNPAFSPDGSMLVYASQRDHQWGIYGVSLGEDGQANSLGVQLVEEPLYLPEDGNAFQPRFSPDGSKLAFVADRREVKVLDLATEAVTTLFGADDYNSSYSEGDQWFAWSPTSEDLLVMWRTIAATGLSTAAIVPADGSARPTLISQALPDFSQGMWSADGSQVLGITTVFGSRTAQLHAQSDDLYRIFLSEEARQDFLDLSEEKTALTEIGAQRYAADRLRSERLEGRLTAGSDIIYKYALADGLSVVLVSRAGGDSYLVQVVNLASGETSTVQEVAAPGLEHVSHVAETNVLDFKLGDAVISVPVFDPNGVGVMPLRMFTTVNPDQQRRAAFEQAWADIKYHFYSAELEGRDWEAIGGKYRSYLGSIATNRELASLVETMFGELSASHLFSNYTLPEGRLAGLGTHNDVLGVYLDHGYEGPGRRIAAILPGGPLDRSGLDIGPGDLIVAINGVPVPEAGGIERLLDVNLGKRALVGVSDLDGSNERVVYVDPIEARAELRLAAKRWRDTRREMVDRLSNGCVVYQYVPAMDNPSYLGVMGRLAAGRGLARAALIDVRSNGGGNLTRELVTLLGGEAYALTGREDGPKAYDPNNRWTDSSAILVDSFVYSDATMYPQAYRDAGVGLIVGDTVLNTGTYVSTYFSRILPGYSHALPTLPIRRLDGTYYENSIIEPDIAVPFDPNGAGIGVDPQLEAAVAALMDGIGPDADCRLQ